MSEEPQKKPWEFPPPKPLPKPHLVNGVPISYDPRDAEGGDAAEQPADDAIGKVIDAETEVDPVEETPPPPPPPPKPAPKRQRPAPKPKAEVPAVREEPAVQEAPIQEAPVKKLTGAAALSKFKQALGAGLFPVKLFSTDEDVLMRELTVTDQKTLSKTALVNGSRRDVIFNAQCALVNSCVKKEGFDINEYTEFDRISLLSRLYQQNYFNNDVHYTCPKCGKENVYKLDFGKILDRLHAAWREDKVYVINASDKEFHFTVGWPKVRTISDFYSKYYKTYSASNEKVQNTIDQLSNVEYLVMFIKGIELHTPGVETLSIDLNGLSYADRTDLIDSLPQGLVFDDERGVINKVISDFTDPLNKAFQYEKCAYCGAETEEGIGSIADFT